MVPPLDGEPQGAVEPGQFVDPKSFGLAFSQPHTGHGHSVLDLIIQRHCIPSQVQPCRKRLQLLARVRIHQLGSVEGDPGVVEVVPASRPIELAAHPSA